MKIEEFELPEAEAEMLSDWREMIFGQKQYDAEKVNSIQSSITGFLSAKLQATNKSK
jgi:hypothetical protein